MVFHSEWPCQKKNLLQSSSQCYWCMYVFYYHSLVQSDVRIAVSFRKGEKNDMQPLQFAERMKDDLVNAKGGAKLFIVKGNPRFVHAHHYGLTRTCTHV